MSNSLEPQALCMGFFPLSQMLCSWGFVWVTPLHPSDIKSIIATLERPSLQVAFCPSHFHLIRLTHSLFLPLSFAEGFVYLFPFWCLSPFTSISFSRAGTLCILPAPEVSAPGIKPGPEEAREIVLSDKLRNKY